MPLIDWLIIVFYLGGLLLLLRLRHIMEADDRIGFRKMVSGLVLMTGGVLWHVYGQLGWFVSVPGLSEPIVQGLVRWSLTFVGMSLLVSGVANWLPVARSWRRWRAERTRLLEVYPSVLSTRRDTISVSELSRQICRALRHALDAHAVAVIALSRSGNSARFLASAGEIDTTDIAWSALHRLGRSDTVSLVGWPSAPGPPSLQRTIRIGSSPRLVVAVWSGQEEEPAVAAVVDQLGGLIAEAAVADIRRHQAADDESIGRMVAVSRELARSGHPEIDRLAKWAAAIRGELELSTVTIARINGRRQIMSRLTIGITAAPLIEPNPRERLGVEATGALATGHYQRVTRLTEHGAQIMLLVPVILPRESVIVTLTRGGRSFTSSEAKRAEALAATVAMLFDVLADEGRLSHSQQTSPLAAVVDKLPLLTTADPSWHLEQLGAALAGNGVLTLRLIEQSEDGYLRSIEFWSADSRPDMIVDRGVIARDLIPLASDSQQPSVTIIERHADVTSTTTIDYLVGDEAARLILSPGFRQSGLLLAIGVDATSDANEVAALLKLVGSIPMPASTVARNPQSTGVPRNRLPHNAVSSII